MSIDVLICSLNKGIVRVDEVMLPPRSDVHYIVSYQYTDERYLDLIPESLSQREDVTLYKYNGQGLSANRNLAMEKSTAELFMYADDDTHFTEETFDTIFETFKQETELDIAFLGQALTQESCLNLILRMSKCSLQCLKIISFLLLRWFAAEKLYKAKYALMNALV